MMSRRAILYGFAGFAGALVASGDGETSFTFGLSPVFLEEMILLSLLQGHLAQQMQRWVVLVKRRAPEDTSVALLSGQLAAAWIADFPYLKYHGRPTFLAAPLYRHQPFCQAYVIVNKASNARTFDDIRGTMHDFSNPDRTSGDLITRWLLALRRAPGRILPSRGANVMTGALRIAA